MVGLGGNNGTTLTAGILANQKKLTWKNKQGEQRANFFGSLTQSVVTKIGVQIDEQNKLKDVFKVIKDMRHSFDGRLDWQ